MGEVLAGGALVARRPHPARARHRDRRAVVTQSRVPAGSGLGGSSALAVAIAAAAGARPSAASWTPDGLWPVVRDAEAQAHRACRPASRTTWPPSTAACSASTSSPGAVAVERAGSRPRARRGVPAARGRRRDALLRASTTGTSSRARSTATPRVREALAAIVAAAAPAARGARRPAATTRCRRCSRAEWEARKRLAPGVTTPEIDRIVEAARVGGRRGQGVRGGRGRHGRGLGAARAGARGRGTRARSWPPGSSPCRSGWTCGASRSSEAPRQRPGYNAGFTVSGERAA